MVVAYQCTGCEQLVSIHGYCLCCPYDPDTDPTHEDPLFDADALVIKKEWDHMSDFDKTDSSDSDSE